MRFRIGFTAFSVLAALAMSPMIYGETTFFSVAPSATDPEIKTFDTPHGVYVNREIVVEQKQGLERDRHELLLWITGTHIPGTPRGNGAGPVAFCELAAELGYRVICLSYPNDIAAAQFRREKNPNAFEQFRMAVIRGGHPQQISIDRPECIENRLIKLLVLLSEKRPRENWGQFLGADLSLKWEAIAVAGQSQGGGHAALIGIKHRVARVICTGAPKDFSLAFELPAAWYRERSATPKSLFFAFNHTQDPMGCSPKQLLENLRVLGLDAYGGPVSVDNESAPYRHSRILMTGNPAVTVEGENSRGALAAHTSVIAAKYADRLRPVWKYMLTEKAP